MASSAPAPRQPPRAALGAKVQLGERQRSVKCLQGGSRLRCGLVESSPCEQGEQRGLCINGRKGLGFYTLRHVFRTVADEAKDQPAADMVMGHQTPGMAGAYRERIADGRLRAVVDYVRAWLFPPPADVAAK